PPDRPPRDLGDPAGRARAGRRGPSRRRDLGHPPAQRGRQGPARRGALGRAVASQGGGETSQIDPAKEHTEAMTMTRSVLKRALISLTAFGLLAVSCGQYEGAHSSASGETGSSSGLGTSSGGTSLAPTTGG